MKNTRQHARVLPPTSEVSKKTRKRSCRVRNAVKKNQKKMKKEEEKTRENGMIETTKKTPRRRKGKATCLSETIPQLDDLMEIHVDLESKSPEKSSSESSLEVQVNLNESFSHFNKSADGELLDGNSDVYRALGFGYVDAEHPTRAEWAEFCRNGGFDRKKKSEKTSTTMDIIEMYYPYWRKGNSPGSCRSGSGSSIDSMYPSLNS